MERDKFERAIVWHSMAKRPARPCGVEMFFGNAPKEMAITAYRDCRRDLGYWDGEVFRETNTGHNVFESWREQCWWPTHWRELPALPEPK